ncbi:hypothetical protein PSTT_06382 [Puccinia striiformis]|uniref:Aminomethyltransferase folate-binding domain-containing protein n=1 Tax=Puccinia striiformis TaxID=27350 RepID=A0A2S4VKH0_9BASI|nr:hypothetical protein PSTT_06382 [Puccinia striiformis]
MTNTDATSPLHQPTDDLGKALGILSSLISFDPGAREWLRTRLVDRGLISLKGEKSQTFLQGLITNNLNKLTNEQILNDRTAVYTAFPHPPADYIWPNHPLDDIDATSSNLQFSISHRIKFGRTVVVTRGWLSNSGNLESAPELEPLAQIPEAPLSAYALHVLLHASLPESLSPPYPIFRKGCYVGQELTARTYHTGVIRKRLVPVSIAKMGTWRPLPFQTASRFPTLTWPIAHLPSASKASSSASTPSVHGTCPKTEDDRKAMWTVYLDLLHPGSR